MRNEIIDKRHALIAQKVIKHLEARHMEGYFAASKEEALEIALKLIPENSVVSWGGSVSISEIGLKQAIKEGPYTAIDRDTATNPAERKQLMKQSLTADVFLMGTNAITEDGQLVNLDGIGNRVAALCYGPDIVIVIAGMNKLVPTLEDAISRTRKYAAPVNAQRFSDTACQQDGACHDCLMKGCICGKLVITRCDMDFGRVKVILVDDNLGY